MKLSFGASFAVALAGLGLGAFLLYLAVAEGRRGSWRESRSYGFRLEPGSDRPHRWSPPQPPPLEPPPPQQPPRDGYAVMPLDGKRHLALPFINQRRQPEPAAPAVAFVSAPGGTWSESLQVDFAVDGEPLAPLGGERFLLWTRVKPLNAPPSAESQRALVLDLGRGSVEPSDPPPLPPGYNTHWYQLGAELVMWPDLRDGEVAIGRPGAWRRPALVAQGERIEAMGETGDGAIWFSLRREELRWSRVQELAWLLLPALAAASGLWGSRRRLRGSAVAAALLVTLLATWVGDWLLHWNIPIR